MELDRRRAIVYDVQTLVDNFYKTLGNAGIPASIAIPDAVITTATMNQVLGYSPFRGTAQLRVKEELMVFGVPPLVVEDLFSKLCARVKEQIERVANTTIFQTDYYWKFVDNETTILIIER